MTTELDINGQNIELFMNAMDEYYGLDDSIDAMHYGTPRHSGRYPWGSGEDPYQHGADFLARVETLKKKGWKETSENVKKEFGLTLDDYRSEKAWSTYERRKDMYDRVNALKHQGKSNSEIARVVGKNESTIRSILNEKSVSKMMEVKGTYDFIKDQVNKKHMVDVGVGVAKELGISEDRMAAALYELKREGYHVYSGRVPQPTNKGQYTTQMVLTIPSKKHADIYKFDEVGTITEYASRDDGKTFNTFRYPAAMERSRIYVRYNEDGGSDRDGLIEIRPGVKDLSLGRDRYSQLRINVENKGYMKGMGVYSDEIPDGYDIVYNTNRHVGASDYEGAKSVFKPLKKDPKNPFGSLISPKGQSEYIGDDGKPHLSLINKRAAAGDWSDWENALPSQFLAKQSTALITKQLNLRKAEFLDELEAIRAIDNPTIRRHYLNTLAGKADSAAVDLKAAALPNQQYHSILPINTLKDNEVFAPNYPDGSMLALCRFPHASITEIPILKVNNKNKEALKFIGANALDAVGINKNVAERMSGADFDGDTVMCIPTHDKHGNVKIINDKPLKALEGFDTKKYQYDDVVVDKNGKSHYYFNGAEFKPMTKEDTQKQMGIVSNLITDMNIGGATGDEIARAIKASMVVIDAEKHKLDWRGAYKENNISDLIQKYQRKVLPDGSIKIGGASTILSRSKGEYTVDKRKGQARINIPGKSWYDPTRPDGALLYQTAPDNELYYTKYKVNAKTGAVKETIEKRTQKSTQMAETDDARTLISEFNHPVEQIYAEYANFMKNLANETRMEMVNTPKLEHNRAAAKEYAEEVKSLNEKLTKAGMNAPRERAALRIANVEIENWKEQNPDFDKKSLKKEKQLALTNARANVGSYSRKERNIVLTDREWKAIQNGAISDKKLMDILANSDPDSLRSKASPREKEVIPDAKRARVLAMSNSNYSNEVIANKLGLTKNQVQYILREEE